MDKFSSITYVRPDGDALLCTLLNSKETLMECNSYEEARAVFMKIEEEKNHFETMQTVASIRNTVNMMDSFYEKEMDYFYGMEPKLNVAMKDFSEALLASSYVEQFREEFGDVFIAQMQSLVRLSDACNIDLKVRESQLVQEYSKIAAAPVTSFCGEEVNFYGLLKHMQSKEREVRKEAFEAWAKLYESISDQLENVYTELMKVRLQMAKNLGYGSFEEMIFDSMGRFTYTPADVAVFREQVCEYVVPICQKLFEEQRKRLGIDTLYYYDEAFVYPEGNAMPVGTMDEQLENARQMYHELSKETGAFFDFMMEHELFDLETKPGKHQGGYCTMLPDFKAPFIFSNFNGTAADVDVLTHEAGHAFEAYEASRAGSLSSQFYSTAEVNEIHSMSMEFFTYPWMELFFGEEAPKYRESHLWDALQCMPYMCCVDEFQHRVYKEELFDGSERRKLWSELEKKYLPWRNYDGNAFLEEGGFWMQKQHIFMYPFYYIDYALARFGSLEYYSRLDQDFQGAWEDYHRLCVEGGKKGYRELLQIGNLSCPFDAGTVKKIMDSIAGIS